MYHRNRPAASKLRLTDHQKIILDIINAGTSDLSEIRAQALKVGIGGTDAYRACRFLRENRFCSGEQRPNPEGKTEFVWAYLPLSARDKTLDGLDYESMRRILFGDGKAPEPAPPTAVEKMILQALDYPKTLAEVVEFVGYPEDVVHRALDSLTAKGLLQSLPMGTRTTWSVVG